MKKFLIIMFAGLLYTSFAHSEDCTKIDYKKNKDEFIECIKSADPNQKKKNPLEILKNMASKSEKAEIDMTSSSDLAIDWECLNLCKQAVKGTFTIGELNHFCISQCPIK